MLDNQGAKECGDSLAVLKYKCQGSLPEALKAELKKSFTSDNRTRIYVIYHDDKSNTNKGTFLFGGRRAPAWSGYSSDGADTTDEG